MNNIVFAYGTLRDRSVLKELLDRIPKTYPAILKGFRLESINLEGDDYPIVIEDHRSEITIEGDYFMVDPIELKKLDIYETDAYRRKKVLLDNGLNAWVYCL